MKRLSLVFVLLALVAFSGLVSAQPATIDQVKVNGVNAVFFDGVNLVAQTIHIDRGQDAVVEVFFTGNDDGEDTNEDGVVDAEDVAEYDGVRVEANIGGYEHGKIEDYTREAFEVREGVSKRVLLRLDVPEDLEASEDYELNLKIWDRDGSHEVTVPLRIEEPRHLLNVYDVIVSPTGVEAGKNVFVSVLVENMGAKKQDRATVSASIPELGVESRKFLDELQTFDAEEDDDDDNEQVVDLSLEIPKNADAGEYDLVVRVEYNRGRTDSEQTYKVRVLGAEKSVETPAGTPAETFVASVDKASQSVRQGQGVVYTLSLANLGDSAKVYTFAVEGAEWGSARVDPQAVTLNKDESKAVLVYVSPSESAAVGANAFTVKVLEGSSVAKEFALTANVTENATGTSYSTFKRVLEIGFIVLLIVLVILGIVLVAKKLAGDDDEDEGIEGQTYY